MGIENFIQDALEKPNDYIAYHIGRELAKLYPAKVIVEGETGSFDLEAFVRAEKCSVVHETSLFNHIRTDWEGPGKQPSQSIQNSWLNVLWRGQLLNVVLVTWSQSCYRSRHHWIIAGDRKLAEDFFSAVCDWSSEVRGEVLVFQDGEWTKNKELFDAIKIATFDNLVGKIVRLRTTAVSEDGQDEQYVLQELDHLTQGVAAVEASLTDMLALRGRS